MARSIFLEDSAEFITASHTLSIAHPSGYPLYLLTTKLISLIPFLPTIVERINFVSLFWTVLGVVGLYFCLSKLYKKTIAWSLSLLFALAPLVWQQATYAEVYSLNTFLLVLLFWLYLRYHDQPSKKRLYLLIFTYGLSLTNHYLPLVLAPLIIVLSLRGRSPQATNEAILTSRWMTFSLKAISNSLSRLLRFTRNDIKFYLKLLGFFLLGLLPYLYIPIRAAMHPAWSWFNGDITKLLTYNIASGHQISASTGRYIFDVMQTIIQSFGWLGLALALGGALFMARRKYYLRHLVLNGSLLFGVIMIILLVGGQGYTIFASQFYKTLHVPMLLITVISIGYFLQQAHDRGYKYQLFYPLLFLLFIIPVINLDETYSQNDRSQYVFLENYSRALLNSLPPDATLLVHHDEIINDPLIFSLAYQRYANNLRPDVIIQSLTPVFRMPPNFPLSEINNYGYEKIKLVEKYIIAQATKIDNLYTTFPLSQAQSNGFVYQIDPSATTTASYYIPDNLNLPATNNNLFARSLLAKYYYDQATRLYGQKKITSGQWFLIQAINYDPQEFSPYYYRVTAARASYLKH